MSYGLVACMVTVCRQDQVVVYAQDESRSSRAKMNPGDPGTPGNCTGKSPGRVEGKGEASSRGTMDG